MSNYQRGNRRNQRRGRGGHQGPGQESGRQQGSGRGRGRGGYQETQGGWGQESRGSQQWGQRYDSGRDGGTWRQREAPRYEQSSDFERTESRWPQLDRGSGFQQYGPPRGSGRAWATSQAAPAASEVSSVQDEPQPSTSAQVKEQFEKFTISDEPPSDSSADTQKSKHKNRKKKKTESESTTTPLEALPGSSAQVSEPPSKGPVEQSSKPSTSTATKESKADEPTFAEIPKRRMKGLIHVGSKYFDPRARLQIEVNYLPIEFSDKNMKIYHYDVEFSDRVNKENAKRYVDEMKRAFFPTRHPAFDGSKNIYAAKDPLFKGDKVSKAFKKEGGKKEREIKVSIQRAVDSTTKTPVELTIANLYKYMTENGCSMNIPMSTIQAVDVALRGNLPDRFVSSGRAFYTVVPERKMELSAGLQLHNGFIQSAIMAQQPYLNVDMSHRGFFTPQPLLEYLRNIFRFKARSGGRGGGRGGRGGDRGFGGGRGRGGDRGRGGGRGRGGYSAGDDAPEPDFSELDRGLSRETWETLNTYVKQCNGLKIRYRDPRTQAVRTYRCTGIGDIPKRALFELKDKDDESRVRSISVYDYFRIEKNYTIQYPNLPVVRAGSKGDYFPLECCSVEEKQPVQNSYTYESEETRSMIGFCKDKPDERKRKILANIEDANFNEDPVLKEFSITVGGRDRTKRFLPVQAASLLSPNVRYRNGHSTVNNGVWEMKEFFDTPTIVNKWIMVNMDGRADDRKAVNNLRDQSVEVGMELSDPLNIIYLGSHDEDSITKCFASLKKDIKDLQLVVVILPGGKMTDIVYRRVKYVSEIKIGLLTQCMKPKTATTMTWMTAKNILLKINSKVTGVNHIINYPGTNQAVFDGSTMFVGADVTHPAPGSLSPSVSAVAGSYDPHGFKYKMLYSVQDSRQEMIGAMEGMIMQLLKFFKEKNNGKFPTKMFYYRDGVSEGQFQTVLQSEMRAIKAACWRLKINVKVTFLVVQKRHHTRFFPARGTGDKNNNVLAGTVVNSQITHPTEHDFYLVSHQSIQGTARPTKYHVLYDEIQEPEDYVEALTYYLCYLFARCTRSVSYPAPTYYSHLAADRAEKYVRVAREKNRDISVGPIGAGTIHQDMVDKNPMYFV